MIGETTVLERLIPYAVAVAIGALVGLQRQFEDTGRSAAGVRSHSLWGLLGVLAADVTERPGGAYVYLAGLAAGAVVLGVTCALRLMRSSTASKASEWSVVGELSQLATYLLAALVQQGDFLLAITLTAGLLTLLRVRESLYRISERFGSREMAATLRFAVVAGAVLPFLHDRVIEPFQLSPVRWWIMVMLVSGMSFVGYLLALFLEHRGLARMGVFSGLVSSTAATLQFSRESRQTEDGLGLVRAQAVLLACSVAFPRTLVLVGLLGSRALLDRLSWPILCTTGVALLFVYGLRRLQRPGDEALATGLQLQNPLRLGSVLSFGLLLGVVSCFVLGAQLRFGYGGLLVLSAISGTAGLSAITLALAGFADPELAARGILLACVTTTLVKAGIVAVLGAPGYRAWTLTCLLGVALVAALGATGWLG
ncbi:MAG: MgtC/SapB family protein [Planctomycetota bacterium]